MLNLGLKPSTVDDRLGRGVQVNVW